MNAANPGLKARACAAGQKVKHCDVRYAVFFAETDGSTVTITRAILTSGQDLFTVFPRCEGLQVNQKLQVLLPKDFFEKAEVWGPADPAEGLDSLRLSAPVARQQAQMQLF